MLKLWSEFSDFLKKCKYFLNFIQGDHGLLYHNYENEMNPAVGC